MILTLLVVALVAPFSAHASYPDGFAWGVAFSAHQTEGVAGGGENSDWYRFEHSVLGGKPTIANGDTADVAVDDWDRYDSDFALASQLGVDTLRISLAWEKIEPAEGQFNDAAIQHYRDVLTSMRAHGIRPMVALHHFTHPLWFADQGAWLEDSSPQRFLEYATYVVSRLDDLCDLWITFNEPMVIVTWPI